MPKIPTQPTIDSGALLDTNGIPNPNADPLVGTELVGQSFEAYAFVDQSGDSGAMLDWNSFRTSEGGVRDYIHSTNVSKKPIVLLRAGYVVIVERMRIVSKVERATEKPKNLTTGSKRS